MIVRDDLLDAMRLLHNLRGVAAGVADLSDLSNLSNTRGVAAGVADFGDLGDLSNLRNTVRMNVAMTENVIMIRVEVIIITMSMIMESVEAMRVSTVANLFVAA